MDNRPIRYEVRTRADGAPVEYVYARAATNEEAEEAARWACSESIPSASVRVVVVGDGRLRAARAAARERFPGWRVDVSLLEDGPEVSRFRVVASRKAAGGRSAHAAEVVIDGHARASWPDGDFEEAAPTIGIAVSPTGGAY